MSTLWASQPIDWWLTVKSTVPGAARSKVAVTVVDELTVAVLGVDERVTTGEGT